MSGNNCIKKFIKNLYETKIDINSVKDKNFNFNAITEDKNFIYVGSGFLYNNNIIPFYFHKDKIDFSDIKLVDYGIKNYFDDTNNNEIISQKLEDVKCSEIKAENGVFGYLKNKMKPLNENYYYSLVKNGFINGHYSGGIVLISNDTINENEIYKIIFKINKYNWEINNYINLLISNKLFKQSIKSAIAGIMSRNMSHNLGSHVLFYVRERLQKLIQDGEEHNPLFKGLVWFLHYVQERQDFIANIVNEDEFSYGPLNLKQDIVDEITPDGVDYRHGDKENKLSEYTNNLLLDNIVKSEHFQRNLEGNKSLELKVKYKGKEFSSLMKGEIDRQFYDINFAVKGGAQSRHAFLIILENIIRNTAKHSDKSKLDTIEITIEIEDAEDDYKIKIYDNAASTEEKAKELNDKLKNIKIIDDVTNETDRDNKGIKEILICVLALRGEDKGNIETIARNNEVLKIEAVKNNIVIETIAENNEILKIEVVNSNIAYVFSLPKFHFNVEIDESENGDKKGEIDISENRNKKHGYIYYTTNKSCYDKFKYIYPRIAEPSDESIDSNKNIPTLWGQALKINDKNTEIIFERDNTINNNICEYRKISLFSKEDSFIGKINRDKKSPLIIFKNHLNWDNFLAHYEGFSKDWNIYIDNISGANQNFSLFQKTYNLAKLINDKDSEEQVKAKNELKTTHYRIINSYETKIVIIDERLSYANLNELQQENGVDDKKNEIKELFKSYKNNKENNENNLDKLFNIAGKDNDIANIDIIDSINDEDALFEFLGNSFINKIIEQDSEEYLYELQNTYLFNMDSAGILYNSKGKLVENFLNYLQPKFISIHLGLIDKLNDDFKPSKGNNSKEDKKDETFICLKNLLLQLYGKNNKENLKNCFISIHSGRGGLADSSGKITFISFANLQRCLEDSKFLLADFFNSNEYIPIDYGT